MSRSWRQEWQGSESTRLGFPNKIVLSDSQQHAASNFEHTSTTASAAAPSHPQTTVVEPKRIFKPVEDYIAQCFSSMECLNSSFLEASESVQRPNHNQIRRKPLPSRATPAVQLPVNTDYPDTIEIANTNTSLGLDPRLLMIGNVAENGLWWTGNTAEPSAVVLKQPIHKKEEMKKPVTSLRPLQLNWKDVEQWYEIVISAAQNWFEVYERLASSNRSCSQSERELHDLEQDLLEGQRHVQTILFRATENFLKRPGRVITGPPDLRFLLVLAENPLLHADPKMFEGILSYDGSRSNLRRPPAATKSSALTHGPLSGEHSGIIKRIIGMLSNAPGESHNQLISWWSKYDETRFIKFKDFVSSFLTYRLLRHREKKQTPKTETVDVTGGLIPQLQRGRTGAYIHDEISRSRSAKKPQDTSKMITYVDDWQVKACARVMALVFAANGPSKAREISNPRWQRLPLSDFYISMIDYVDLVFDFDSWESKKSKFSFCQYPFLMSIWAKTQVLEHDTRRQMATKARDAFLDSILSRRNVSQYFFLDVRRDCLVEDSLRGVSEVIGSGSDDIKKGLKITFHGEEGIDGGGLRKEWFLLLVREVFNPEHGESNPSHRSLPALQI